MKVVDTAIADVKIIEPSVFGDARGWFYESFNEKKFRELTGVTDTFVQDNHSKSAKGVLRGLHYQIQSAQGKLVRVVAGEVFDVAVDIRKSSPTFGKHVAVVLSAENQKMFWVPKGFAHGFMALTEGAEFLYKTTDYWVKPHERSIRWDDPALAIEWPIHRVGVPAVNEKDQAGALLVDAELFA